MSTARPILVRGARQLLTLRGSSGTRRGVELSDLGVVRDGAVLISGNRIIDVGPSRRVENLAVARSALEIDAKGGVVLPGFVDTGTRLLVPEPGGAAAFARTVDNVSARYLEVKAHKLLQACLRGGTTTLEAKSGFGLPLRSELKVLRALSALNERSQMVVTAFCLDSVLAAWSEPTVADAVHMVCAELFPAIARRELAQFVEAGPFTLQLDPDLRTQLFEAARDHGFALKVSTQTLEDDLPLCLQWGCVRLNYTGRGAGEDWGALARSHTIVTLSPPQSETDDLPQLKARRLIEAGVAVALASGSHSGTAPGCSMLNSIAFACHFMQMSIAEAITAATVNGAHAVRRGSFTGTLEVNRQADLVILAIPDYREIPYHVGGNLVEATIKQGEVVHPAAQVAGA